MLYLCVVFLSANISVLLAFLSRLYDGFSVPLFVIRLVTIIVLGALAFGPSEYRHLFACVAGGLTCGLVLGYWDELSVLYRYQLTETFVLPALLCVLLVPLVISICSGYAKK